MAYGWGEHTGELELWVTGSSEAEVFAEALRAMGDPGQSSSSGCCPGPPYSGRLLIPSRVRHLE